ncbi:hypothetical protein BDF20DRAFT_986350 [Mycotypha africana]|uniref:uncharacterized protein n=1 Tax=Mycotypha africana TaxID=64632 RepID=UPI00230020A9|nr:uncharacterized protein BDF20DRAFT_986350 [Mycotypha africana]KAI8984467.1 hypothetical protein BDF20DRAFT_986350 [Mycotypha africana]
MGEWSCGHYIFIVKFDVTIYWYMRRCYNKFRKPPAKSKGTAIKVQASRSATHYYIKYVKFVAAAARRASIKENTAATELDSFQKDQNTSNETRASREKDLHAKHKKSKRLALSIFITIIQLLAFKAFVKTFANRFISLVIVL